MSLNVSKHLILCIFTAALIGCSSDEDSPACQYKSQPQFQLQPSTAPKTLGLAFDQQKLIELMWTTSAQSECFLRKNSGVRVFKISSGQTATDETFVTLKQAPLASQKNWNGSQEEIRANSSEPALDLLGLTTFLFYSTPTEKIVSAEILLRADGRPWHLWHEYAHVLIGELRVKSLELSLRNPRAKDVKDALQEALAQTTAEDFAEKFATFSKLQIDYMQKTFLDEVLIERTLQNLISQSSDLLPVDQRDFQESQAVIDRFTKRYQSYLERQHRELTNTMATLSDDQRILVQAHLGLMREQNLSLLGLAL
jgi:hypothetical protein